ncbi:unnamed protein product [Peronospora destructor]|uniref:Uncharacterized protein n=1 Tax=Peronospora destructor TaxID=86335 RepID=A0AAV0SYQ8_9STRA|nr:unnamed protein product [Peronospora destructor]
MSRRDTAKYDRELLERMEPTTFAVKCMTDRWVKNVRGAAVTIALVAASIIATISTVIAMHTDNTLTTCAAVGSFAGVLSACLAPTRSDGVAILVHEGALTVTGMNIMLVHYTEPKMELVFVDYLFVALASWAIIVILRIIMSKKMLECFLMVTLDTVALLHVTLIMMEVLDIVEHPLANNLSFEQAAFFVTVASAELGHYLFNMVTCQLMHRLLWRWRHMSSKLSVVSDFIVSVLVGAVGMVIVMLVGDTDMNTGNIVILLGAVGLSQLGRSFLSLIHETAMAPSWSCATFSFWNNGMMELMNPFLVGWIVFNPYAKTFLEAKLLRGK